MKVEAGAAVAGSDTRALLASVLQSIEAEVGHARDIFSWGIESKHPACFMWAVECIIPEPVHWHRYHLLEGGYFAGSTVAQATTCLPVLVRVKNQHVKS
jgi:hypothetical protein